MRRFLLGIVVAAMAYPQTREKRIAPVSDAQRQNYDRQTRVAVLVGIGAYPESSGLSPLKYAATDVKDLAAELEGQGGKWGVVNSEGQWVLAPRFNRPLAFFKASRKLLPPG